LPKLSVTVSVVFLESSRIRYSTFHFNRHCCQP